MTYLRHEDGGFDTRKTGAEEEVMREVLLFFLHMHDNSTVISMISESTRKGRKGRVFHTVTLIRVHLARYFLMTLP